MFDFCLSVSVYDKYGSIRKFFFYSKVEEKKFIKMCEDSGFQIFERNGYYENLTADEAFDILTNP